MYQYVHCESNSIRGGILLWGITPPPPHTTHTHLLEVVHVSEDLFPVMIFTQDGRRRTIREEETKYSIVKAPPETVTNNNFSSSKSNRNHNAYCRISLMDGGGRRGKYHKIKIKREGEGGAGSMNIKLITCERLM